MSGCRSPNFPDHRGKGPTPDLQVGVGLQQLSTASQEGRRIANADRRLAAGRRICLHTSEGRDRNVDQAPSGLTTLTTSSPTWTIRPTMVALASSSRIEAPARA